MKISAVQPARRAARFGKQILVTVSQELTAGHGCGFQRDARQELSTALREMQADPHFSEVGELQPVSTHKEYLSVRRQHFKRRLDVLLEGASV